MDVQFDRFKVMPKFSLEPNKVSYYNEVLTKCKVSDNSYELRILRNNSGIKRKFHNFEISPNAYRTLKKKINWLYYLAKPKTIKTYSGREIYNFKICFLTLTLPSKQKQPTVEITKNLFNQFLTEVRQRTGLKNYVWRLEFQKNGNVHYHIVADAYIDYFFCRQIWNRILDKAGYIQDYADKFSNLSLFDYNKLVNGPGATDFKIIAKRYAKGCSEKWRNPNTVDVKSVISNKAIANYISKYFGKSPNGEANCNVLDNPENSKTMRLWFCSRSLSKLRSVSDYCEAVQYDIFELVKKVGKTREILCQYARLIYFEITDKSNKIAMFINKLLKVYAKSQGYYSSVPVHI